jgi:hypothetical protein
MRDLTLLDTGYLAGLLILSLVLPLMPSLRRSRQPVSRRSCLRTVWTGQALLVIAAVGVLASTVAAPFAMLFGLLSCGVSAVALHQQLNAATGVYRVGE